MGNSIQQSGEGYSISNEDFRNVRRVTFICLTAHFIDLIKQDIANEKFPTNHLIREMPLSYFVAGILQLSEEQILQLVQQNWLELSPARGILDLIQMKTLIEYFLESPDIFGVAEQLKNRLVLLQNQTGIANLQIHNEYFNIQPTL
jgi:hypothetical protein